MRKRQNEMTSSSKNGEYLILGQNSDFREKFGILELEMSHPDRDVVVKSGPIDIQKTLDCITDVVARCVLHYRR